MCGDIVLIDSGVGGVGESGEREKDETVVETRVKKVAIRWQSCRHELHTARR